MKNIIIFGQAGAGKTTAAKIIQNKCIDIWIDSLGRFIHEDCKKYGNETREEMQQYGQAMRNIFGQNIWNNCLFDHYKSVMHEINLIIDDGRQDNEYDFWKEEGFLTLGIIAPYEVRKQRILERSGYEYTPEMDSHETELQAARNALRCDIVIHNDSDKSKLKRLLVQNKVI